MASEQETTIPLKLWVDKERNCVVMAEASGDFVDVLFNFLTLPLGTIMRLVSKNQPHPPVEIGCINNLYQSVENCSTEVFWNHICKQMLLSPRSPCEAPCQRLKLNVDDTESTKYFTCNMCSSGCIKGRRLLLSTFSGVNCSCGKLMNKERGLIESKKEAPGNGVFVKEFMYLIFDDLRVRPSSPGNYVQQLLQFGYKDFKKMTEMTLNVGMKEVFSILKQALTSKSPLSDVFLAHRGCKPTYFFSPYCPSYHTDSVKLKITVSKSENWVLFAESEGDFVDFLFSFLTTPLGCILNLREGESSLGCMSNLYSSVEDLDSSWFTGSPHTSLLKLQVAHQFGCEGNPLLIWEEFTFGYWYSPGLITTNRYSVRATMISKDAGMLEDAKAMTLFEPRSPDGESAVGFVRRPSLFIVSDDLQVTPLTNTSSISFLQKLNVPLDDFEEHLVEVGKKEALNLLAASLTSKAALTNSLFSLLKKPKEEID